MQETFEFLARGGPVMAIIGVVSVVALAIFIERMWALQKTRILPPRLIHLLREAIDKGKFDEARALCGNNDTSISLVALAGLNHAKSGRSVIRESMQDRGRREVAELEKGTGLLGSLAQVTPLLGLLGTITGMIKTFQRVNDSVVDAGQVSPGALANGIWEALITTAAGLAVAIPTFLAYRVIIGRIDRFTVDLEEVALDLADRIDRHNETVAESVSSEAAIESESEE